MQHAAELHRLIENLVRVGTIAAVDHERARARVRSGELLTDWLPWLSPRAGTTADWDPPTTDEQVLVFSPGGDPHAGVILTGVYRHARPAPAAAANIRRRDYPDGTRIDYDHGAGVLTVDCVGDVVIQGARTLTVDFGGTVDVIAGGAATVKAPSVTLDTPQTTCTGALTVQGPLTYQGGMTGSGGSGAAAAIQGDVQVTGGDVTAETVSLREHTHPENDGGDTGAPNA